MGPPTHRRYAVGDSDYSFCFLDSITLTLSEENDYSCKRLASSFFLGMKDDFLSQTLQNVKEVRF